jgi:two-component system osmolarity sensor histidine kinase EnvZ
MHPDPKNGTVSIFIEDNGPGISDERKAQIFTRLTMDRPGGSGIGLTLVKQILDRYGAKAHAEDRILGDPKEGARIVLTFPMVGSALAKS